MQQNHLVGWGWGVVVKPVASLSVHKSPPHWCSSSSASSHLTSWLEELIFLSHRCTLAPRAHAFSLATFSFHLLFGVLSRANYSSQLAKPQAPLLHCSCRNGTGAKRDNRAQEKFRVTPCWKKRLMRRKREPRSPWQGGPHGGLTPLEKILHLNIWQQRQHKSPAWSPKVISEDPEKEQPWAPGCEQPQQIPVDFSLFMELSLSGMSTHRASTHGGNAPTDVSGSH